MVVVPEEMKARKGNRGASLVLLGVLFFFLAYLGYQDEQCYQYENVLGTPICVAVYYPYRNLGIFVGLMGLISFVVGLALISQGE